MSEGVSDLSVLQEKARDRSSLYAGTGFIGHGMSLALRLRV